MRECSAHPFVFDALVRPRVKPTSQTYAYVLLPGASVERSEKYASDPQIEIIEHFWKDGPKMVGEVTCQQNAALLIKETGGGSRLQWQVRPIEFKE